MPPTYGTFKDLLFHCASVAEPVDQDWLLLPNAVATVLRLQVSLGIPIRVKDDDCVGRD